MSTKKLIKKEQPKKTDFKTEIESEISGFLKFSPKNSKEERELLLIRMIRQAEDRFDENLSRIEALKFELKKNENRGSCS